MPHHFHYLERSHRTGSGSSHSDPVPLHEPSIIPLLEGEVEAASARLKLYVALAEVASIIISAHAPEHHHGN
jgi:hypothetical protein